MKRLQAIIAVVFALSLFAACNNEDKIYDGPSYVLFADTLSICPVVQSGEPFSVDIAATRIADRDRTFGVEIIDAGSNAVDGYHYRLESSTVTIPAGQQATSVKIQGVYDHIEADDSLGFRLRLVAPKETDWELYGIETKVRLQKVCPFVLENFTGYARVESYFQVMYKPNDKERIITTSIAPDKPNTITLHGFLYDGYDTEIEFDNEKALSPRLTISDAIIGTTGEAFGTIYGDGVVRVENYQIIPSLFSSCLNQAVVYATLYVKDFGVVGAFSFNIEWISDDEANGIL